MLGPRKRGWRARGRATSHEPRCSEARVHAPMAMLPGVILGGVAAASKGPDLERTLRHAQSRTVFLLLHMAVTHHVVLG